MSTKMNWRKARLASKQSLDHRWEFTEFNRDRADKWLAAVERRLLKQRTITVSSAIRRADSQ